MQADPRSPEHGQYGFLQDLVRHVAYETLSKKERRARHLAAAASPERRVRRGRGRGRRGDRVALPRRVRGRTGRRRRRRDQRARRRRCSCAPASAPSRWPRPPRRRRYFEQAAELTDDPSERAALLDRAGRDGLACRRSGRRQTLLEESIALLRGRGRHSRRRPHVDSRLARVDALHRPARRRTRTDGACVRRHLRRRARTKISRCSRTSSSIRYWSSPATSSARPSGPSLRSTSPRRTVYPEALALALRAKAGLAHSRGHPAGARGASQAAARRSRSSTTSRNRRAATYFFLSDHCFQRDRYDDALEYLDEALALARRLGDRPSEWSILAERTYPLFMLGRWDEALEIAEAFTQEQVDAGGTVVEPPAVRVEIHLQRGERRRGRSVCLDVLAPRGLHRRPGARRASSPRHAALSALRVATRKRSPTRGDASRRHGRSASHQAVEARASS